jgi:phasin family protein
MAAEVKKLMTDTTAALAAPVAQARKVVDETAAQARVAMEKGMEQATKSAEGFFKAFEEAGEFGRGNIEVMTKVTQTLTVGWQDLGRQYFAVAQGMTDHALEGAKALAAAKSLKEAADLQTSFAKAAMEKAMAETVKLNEASFRLVEQAFAPLAARASLAVEKMGKPLAA